jgi:polyhydroxyalkanoate synthesis regulator phasin
VLEDVKIVPIVFEKRLYLELAEAAKARGTSVSALIRIIVSDYLSRSKQTGEKPNQPAKEDPPGIDPVIRADVEDFEEEVSRLESTLTNIESEVARNPHLTKPIANPLLESIRQNLMSSISNAEDKLKKLRQKYYYLRRVARGYEGLDKLAAKLYDLRKRIRDLRKQLSGRASRG